MQPTRLLPSQVHLMLVRRAGLHISYDARYSARIHTVDTTQAAQGLLTMRYHGILTDGQCQVVCTHVLKPILQRQPCQRLLLDVRDLQRQGPDIIPDHLAPVIELLVAGGLRAAAALHPPEHMHLQLLLEQLASQWAPQCAVELFHSEAAALHWLHSPSVVS